MRHPQYYYIIMYIEIHFLTYLMKWLTGLWTLLKILIRHNLWPIKMRFNEAVVWFQLLLLVIEIKSLTTSSANIKKHFDSSHVTVFLSTPLIMGGLLLTCHHLFKIYKVDSKHEKRQNLQSSLPVPQRNISYSHSQNEKKNAEARIPICVHFMPCKNTYFH